MATENLTTYTEVDPGAEISVIIEFPSTVTGVNVLANKDTYLYKDFGVGYFGTLNVDFEIYTGSEAVKYYGIGGIGFLNSLNDLSAWTQSDPYCVAQTRSATVVWIRLGGGLGLTEDIYVGVPDTSYYITMTRTAGATTLTAKIYSDAARTNLLDTLTITGMGGETWRYFYAFVNANDATSDRQWNGYVQNINLHWVAPTVTTQAVTDIKPTTVTGNGNITALGDPSATQHGHCWSTSANPTTANSKTQKGVPSGTGAFTSAITGLTANTLYHVRAYVTNAVGTSYGADVEFTTLIAPAVPIKTFIPRTIFIN